MNSNHLTIYALYNEISDCVSYQFDAYEVMDLFDDFLGNNFIGKPLPTNWQLPKHTAENTDCPLNDFVDGYFQAPYISDRARRLLEPIVGQEAEFRSIGQILGNDYFVMNIINLVDCLDKERSEITWSTDGRILLLAKAVFFHQRIRARAVFKIPEYPSRIYVTNEFVDNVRQHRLTGVGIERADDVGLAIAHPAFDDLPLRGENRKPQRGRNG